MSLQRHPLKEFLVDFATFSGLTKMAITSSKMDELKKMGNLEHLFVSNVTRKLLESFV